MGIEVIVVPLEFTATQQRVFVRRDFDLAFASYCNGPDPDIGVKRMYVSSNIQSIPFYDVRALAEMAAPLVVG